MPSQRLDVLAQNGTQPQRVMTTVHSIGLQGIDYSKNRTVAALLGEDES